MHVFGQWKAAGAPGEIPCVHGEKIHMERPAPGEKRTRLWGEQSHQCAALCLFQSDLMNYIFLRPVRRKTFTRSIESRRGTQEWSYLSRQDYWLHLELHNTRRGLVNRCLPIEKILTCANCILSGVEKYESLLMLLKTRTRVSKEPGWSLACDLLCMWFACHMKAVIFIRMTALFITKPDEHLKCLEWFS